MMRKVIFYNFFPTKAEEEAAKARNSVHHVTPLYVVEIRDNRQPPPRLDDAWIEKVVDLNSISTGKLYLSHHETFDHVFQHWTVEQATHIVAGNRMHVMIMDVTDGNGPMSYHGENVFFEKGPHCDSYALGCKDLFEKHVLHLGEEIGLRWSKELGLFQFQIIKYQGENDRSGVGNICLKI
ncbi:hypothetical protein CJ030_MR1G018603 [Morella rubra]|uniref:Uncharacterized protein n=1 Tax=Morella rubra TaxID=262757 RepID=A0A6A1WK39_9ROSI|nr:hypothetical protein CJ030_MR1G018603 [Morella rubra]